MLLLQSHRFSIEPLKTNDKWSIQKDISFQSEIRVADINIMLTSLNMWVLPSLTYFTYKILWIIRFQLLVALAQDQKKAWRKNTLWICSSEEFVSMSILNFTIQNHRIMEWLRLEGASRGQLFRPSSLSRAPTASSAGPWPDGFKASSKGEDCPTSLGSLWQCYITLTVTKCCLMFWCHLCFNLCPLLVIMSGGTTGNAKYVFVF